MVGDVCPMADNALKQKRSFATAFRGSDDGQEVHPMSSYRGHFQARYGHPDIIVQAEPAYEPFVQSLFDFLEQEIRSGLVFRAQETVRIGWTTVRLEAAACGALEIMEPDFGSMPITWRPGANATIAYMFLHRQICDCVSVDVAFSSMLDVGVVSPDFLRSPVEFELSRDVPAGSDSGWVFREIDYRGSSAKLCSLYEIAVAVPAVVPFLGLPPGSVVRRRKDALEISAKGSVISSSDNEFLQRLLGSANFGYR